MVFLCFSGKNRDSFVKSLVSNLNALDIEIWYDETQIKLGDNLDYENLENGIRKSKYAIVILSKEFFKSSWPIVELKMITELWEKNEISIFPILYKIDADEVPYEYKWLCEIKYYLAAESSGTLPICMQILHKIIYDFKISNCAQKELAEILLNTNNHIKKLVSIYKTICSSTETNYTKTYVLYCIYSYLLSENSKSIFQFGGAVEKIFSFCSANLYISSYELQTLEDIIIIMINKFNTSKYQ